MANLDFGKVDTIDSPDDCDFLSLGEESLLFEKEHAYPGMFAMKAGKEGEVPFELTEEGIKHLAKESQRYLDNGNQCNLPVEHTNDPEKNRGKNLKWFAKKDSKGRLGLFSLTEFRDVESAKLAKTAQTSIYAPGTYKDGAMNEYVRPVRHVALTDYPVIPGLDGFTPIAASLIDTPKKGRAMTIKDLAVGIGLELSEDILSDDEKVSTEITTAYELSQAELKTAKEAKEAVDLELAEYKAANPQKKDPVKVPKAHLNMLKENRELKLSQLVKDGNILTCVAKELEDIFCGEAALTLSLSEDDESEIFDKVVKALRDNDAIKLSEVTQPQVSKLPELDATTNPMIADAERRAASTSN